MTSAALRAIQEPLKAEYRTNPGSALITLKAKSKLSDGISCKVETGKTLAHAGLHPATGGDGLTVCSGDMLLEALAACAGVTLKAVATAMDLVVEDATVHVEGDLDFRGTLSVDKYAPVGFKDIRMRFDIRSSGPDERIEKLIRLTERYCVVYQTLIKANAITLLKNCQKNN